MTKEFILSTDASRSGIAYILSQKDDTGLEPVIAFNGRLLSKRESNWGVTEIEYLTAVICGIKTYRHYLADKPLYVLSRLVDTAPEKDMPEDDSWANPATVVPAI